MSDMSAADLVMDSEKEETVTPAKILAVQQEEEVIPGSSPEGVFSNEEEHIFEPIEHQNDLAPHHIPLQVEELKHGEEIVEEHADDIDQGEIMVEEGEQQFMNMVQITQEDVYEAGFDIEDLNHLTEEQLNIVVAFSQQRQARQHGERQNLEGEDVEEGPHHNMIHHGMMGNDFEGDGAGADGNEYAGDDGHMSGTTMQLTITSDGGVNITDAKQRQFFISPTEIANLNIDLNHLSNEHVNQLVQLALPSIKESDEKSEGTSYSREVLDPVPSIGYHHRREHFGTGKAPRNPIIGETVQIRTTDGRLQDAVVKYSRRDSEYKVQFTNGLFAYATIDEMLIPPRSRGDHDNYQVSAPMLIRRTDVAHLATQKRAANSNEDLCPPVLKRSYHLAPVVDGPHLVHTPNFCCPICDKKVFQKEPSYIVIRLPACDSCTREKIIVLDEQNS